MFARGVNFCGNFFFWGGSWRHVFAKSQQLIRIRFHLWQGWQIRIKFRKVVGRGEKFYNAKNVETKIFRQEFPDIPVVGFFGNGELGLDLHSCEGKLERDGHFLHSYSSVFCLCSLTPQSNDSSIEEGTVPSHPKVSDVKEKPSSSHSTWLNNKGFNWLFEICWR